MTGILWAVPITPIALPRRYPNAQLHHCTLQYEVERAAMEHLIGLPVTIAVTEEVYSDRIQAVVVVLPTWLPCQNIHPHISVSWVDNATPVEANEMLEGEYQKSALDFDHVHCLIEWQEWGEKPIDPRNWSDRSPVLCPTCKRQGIETYTRSVSGHCRKHRN